MKSLIPRTASFCLFVLHLVFCADARSQEFPTDEADVAKLMKATGIRPIRVPESARNYEEFRREDMAWIGKHAIEPALAALRKEPYGDRVAPFIEKAWAPLSVNRISPDQALALRNEAFVFTREGIKDPLLEYIIALLWRWSPNQNGVERAFYAAVRLLDDKVDDPRFAMFDLIATVHYAAVNTRLTDRRRARIVQRLEEAAAQKAFADNPHEMANYFTMAFELAPADMDHLLSIIEKAEAPEWTKKLIRGEGEVKRAWRARGGGLASTVTEEGWQGFRMHLEKARELLTESWKLNPKDPKAATAMISVVMGAGPAQGEDFQTWHERAIAACADYPDAYSRLERLLMPRWHGSPAHELAFAFACADSNRPKSRIPDRFISLLDRLENEVPDRHALYRVPVIGDRVIRILRAKTEGPEAALDPVTHYGRLAVFGWITGRMDVAQEALHKMRGRWSPSVDAYLHNYEISRLEFLFDCRTSGTGLELAVKAARDARSERNYREARALLASMIPLLPHSTAQHLWYSLRLLAIEEKIDSGEWVALEGENGHVGWLPLEGQIFTQGEDATIFRGGKERFRYIFTARVGSDFELKGKVKFKHRPDGFASFGVVFERNPLGLQFGMKSAITLELKLDSATAGSAALVHNGRRVSHPQPVEAREDNEFHLRKVGNRVTLTWNGNDVSAELPKDFPIQKEPLMGLGWLPQTYGTSTQVSELQVRRLSKNL